MNRRLRAFVGAVTILIFVPLYALVAMALAQGRVTELGQPWQSLVYVALGLVWILPLMPLIRWMEGRKRDGA